MEISEFYWIPAGILGVFAGLSGLAAAGSYVQYKRAKQRYQSAKMLGLETVKDAVDSGVPLPRQACIEGTVESIEHKDPVMYFKKEKQLSTVSRMPNEQLLKRYYSNYYLKSKDGTIIQVMPGMDTVMLGLNRRKEKQYGWVKTLLLSVAHLKIALGTAEYFVYDGDFLTIFGVLKYSPGQKQFIMDADCVTSSGFSDILSYLKNEVTVWPTIGLGLLFGATAIASGYFGYNYYNRHRNRQ